MLVISLFSATLGAVLLIDDENALKLVNRKQLHTILKRNSLLLLNKFKLLFQFI